MDSRGRAIASGIEAFGKFLAEKGTQDREAINGRLSEMEAKLHHDVGDRLRGLEDKEAEREREARFPGFVRSLILQGEIKRVIQDGLARHRTVSQIASEIRELAADLEDHFERR